MNWCIIENGIIENVIVADEYFADIIGAQPFYDGATIGAMYMPPEPTPTPEQDRDAMLADLALRTTLLEMGVI